MNLVELTIEQPDNTAAQRAQQALDRAEAFQVTDVSSYEAAAAELTAIKQKWNDIETSRKALKKPIDDAARAVQAFFKPPLDFLARAEATLKRTMVTWKNEQERIAREEQRKAEEKARKERERLEREAAKAEAAGRTERAEVLRDRAEITVPVIPPPAAPKVSGIADRKMWRFEIVDASLLPREYLIPDEKRIRGVVNALKGDANIPGVRVFEESTLAARRF